MSEPHTLTLEEAAPRRAKSGAAVPCLFVVIHADAPTRPSSRHVLGDVARVRIGRAPETAVKRVVQDGASELEIGIEDRWMSSAHAVLERTAEGAWVLSDCGSKNGTLLHGERIASAPLEDGTLFEVGRTFLRFRASMAVPAEPLDVSADALAPLTPHLATLAEPLASAFDALARVATSNLAVVVGGESGTGKEGIARAVHQLSGRSGRFVPVNCGAISENLVESELFGHRRGAFSGATEDKPGLVRAADRGTLFLDEIGDLPLSAQAALLRVLQEREVVPVGANQAVAVDLRVVAATHRDLDRAVASGTFRQDLLARIRGYTMNLPALRDRTEDFGIIVAALLRRIAMGRAEEISFEPSCLRALLRYDWPTNVRELEQALTAATVIAGASPLDVEHFQIPLPRDAEGSIAPLTVEDEARKTELAALLDRHGGNVSAVAREMGKARMQIQRWMKRYGLRER